jgi:nitrogen fixation/metabolism regulation signal transduction histidine kinase
MLGLALVNMWGGTGRNSKTATAAIVCFILLVHFLLVLSCEFASSQGVALAIATAIAMMLEIVISVVLFLRSLRLRPAARSRGAAPTLLASRP